MKQKLPLKPTYDKRFQSLFCLLMFAASMMGFFYCSPKAAEPSTQSEPAPKAALPAQVSITKSEYPKETPEPAALLTVKNRIIKSRIEKEAAPSKPRSDEASKPLSKPESNKPQRDPLLQHYLGTHRLGVNRVTDGRRIGTATITQSEDGRLHLAGSVRKGSYHLTISGTVNIVDKRKFHLIGRISGVPDLSWRDEPPRARTTKGRFTFEATKNRRYWRLYNVNDRNCVCWDNCGNDFCYIDIEF